MKKTNIIEVTTSTKATEAINEKKYAEIAAAEGTKKPITWLFGKETDSTLWNKNSHKITLASTGVTYKIDSFKLFQKIRKLDNEVMYVKRSYEEQKKAMIAFDIDRYTHMFDHVQSHLVQVKTLRKEISLLLAELNVEDVKITDLPCIA